MFQTETLQDTLQAKQQIREKKNAVYDEVEDNGEDCISVRWVITPKIINGKLGYVLQDLRKPMCLGQIAPHACKKVYELHCLIASNS